MTAVAKLNLRQGPITQETFDRLPALLTAWQVMEVTGWSYHELAAEVKAGTIEAWKRPVRQGHTRSYHKYTKVSVGRAVGFRV